jgi:hypothetical protein
MTSQTPRARNGRGKFTRTAESRARDYRAAELHGQGWSYQRIADELGFASRGHASNAVSRAYADMPTEEAQQARQADLDRIDRLIEQAWQVMVTPHITVSNGKVVRQLAGFELRPDGTEALDADGKRIPVFADILDDGPRLAAVNTIRGLLERRARIFGYDAPAKSRVEVITADMVESQIAELEQQLARNDPASTGPG